MPYFGRLIDRIGSKTAIIAVGIGLSLVIYLASFVSDIFNLTAIYIGLRFFGQGALTLAATTLIAKTVLHRPGLALGMIGAIGRRGCRHCLGQEGQEAGASSSAPPPG